MGDIEKVEVDDRKSRTIFQGKHSTALFLSRSTMDIGRIYNRAFSVKSIMSILIRPPAGVQQWKTKKKIQFWTKQMSARSSSAIFRSSRLSLGGTISSASNAII